MKFELNLKPIKLSYEQNVGCKTTNVEKLQKEREENYKILALGVEKEYDGMAKEILKVPFALKYKK